MDMNEIRKLMLSKRTKELMKKHVPEFFKPENMKITLKKAYSNEKA